MSPGRADVWMAAATWPAWVRLVTTLGTDAASPSTMATAMTPTRTWRSRKTVTPSDTRRINGTKTTEAYRASKALVVTKPPMMAAASVPTITTARGRPVGRVRMSSEMWSRSVASPKRPRPNRAKKSSASPRPWLVLPPANDATALTMAAKVAGVAQGVPVCCDWKTKVGNHGRKARQPTSVAASAARAPRRHDARPRQAWKASHRMTVPRR